MRKPKLQALLLVMGILLTGSVSFAETVEFTEAVSDEIQPQEALQSYLKGDWAKADAQAREFLKAHPGSSMAYELIGAAAFATKDYAKAEEALAQSVELEPDRPSSWIRYGQTALESGNAPLAAERFSKAVEKWPELGAAHRNLALALFRQGKLDQAMKRIEKALSLSEKVDLDALYLKASFHHEGRQPDVAESLLEVILKEQPGHPDALLLQGIVKVELAKYDQAESILNQVIEKDPESPWAKLGLALIVRSKGDFKEAVSMLKELTEKEPKWMLPLFQLAETHLMAGETDKAVKLLRQGEQNSQNPIVFRMQSGWTFLKHGADERALEHAKRAIAEAEDQGDLKAKAYLLLIRAANGAGGPDRVEAELKELEEVQNGEDYYPVMHLGWHYLRGNRPDLAEKQFEKAAKLRPAESDPVMAQAQTLAAQGKKAEAVRTAKQAVEMPGAAEKKSLLAQIYEQVGDPEQAEALYQKILEQEPENVPVKRRLAKIYADRGDYRKAAETLIPAEEMTPQEAAGLYSDLGHLYHKTEDLENAARAYRKSLEYNANQPLILNNLAYILGSSPETLEDAVPYAERAHDLAPEVPDIMDTLGFLYGRTGKLDRAEELLHKAVELESERPEFRYHLGFVYAKQGRRSDAVRELMRATTQGPSFPELNQAAALLESFQ